MKRAQTSALIQSRGFKFHPYTAMSKLTNLPVSSVCPQGRSHEHLKVSEDKAKCLLFTHTHTHPFFFPSFPLFRSTSLALSSSFSYPASNPSANPGSSSFRISPESPPTSLHVCFCHCGPALSSPAWTRTATSALTPHSLSFPYWSQVLPLLCSQPPRAPIPLRVNIQVPPTPQPTRPCTTCPTPPYPHWHSLSLVPTLLQPWGPILSSSTTRGTSGHLHWLCPLPGPLFPKSYTWLPSSVCINLTSLFASYSDILFSIVLFFQPILYCITIII